MNYSLLPFQFKPIANDSFLIVNECGDYYFLQHQNFSDFVSGKLVPNTPIFYDLKSNNFLADTSLPLAIDLLATKYRSRKRFLSNFSALHMMVITLRCNQDCHYCQVSSTEDDAYIYDMKPETARKIVDYIFMSPSSDIKIEFQGGEPSLNWETITATVGYALTLNKKYKKNLDFILCTNLTSITEDKLHFLKEKNVYISTSLDGPKFIHDENRVMRNNHSSYVNFRKNLDLAREIVGVDRISALVTITKDNISHVKEIIEEYLDLGFGGLFFRGLNPYGEASKNVSKLGYDTDTFLSAYKDTINYLIDLNLAGTRFTEYYTTLLLTRILTPFSTGFVDLQSPSGAGISGVIYDYNGDVYPADEARMLSRMGDKYFLMGNVTSNSYLEIFKGSIIRDIVEKSCVEIMPQCADCVYQSYCGADPIRNYLETKDIMGHRPSSDFCKKNMAIFDFLFEKIRDNERPVMNVLWSWITKR